MMSSSPPIAQLSMLSQRLKALREARSWSQAHLAEAARVNIRTVQRIEAGEPASPETLLSLAAALDVELAELEPEARLEGGAWDLSWAKVAIAIVCVTPAALFIVVNLLRSVAGVSGPFDMLAAAGGRVMSFEAFNLVSPVIFLGGPAAAFLLGLPALVRIRMTRIGDQAISISGVDLRAQWQAAVVVATAILVTTILVGYAALELLRTPLP
jgi:transcriptional regulator with XRE-family HTH domain